jgi:hypothetical protein
VRRLAILLGALVCVPVAPALAAQRPDGQLKAQLLPAHPSRKPAEPGPRAHRLRTRNPHELASAKRAAGQGIFSAPLPGQSPTPSAAVTGGLNQPGIAASDNSAANQGTPPDPTGAIGPSDYVEFVNSKVAVYSSSDLSLVGSMADLDAFVGAPGDDVFDPQIQWDPQSSRWFYLADDAASSTSNFLVFGFSKTSDPTDLSASGWCRYAISIGTAFDDYPKLGHDDNHVLFGTNVFSNNGPTGTFSGARIWSMPKPAAGTITTCPTFAASFFGGPTNPLRTADGDQAFTPVPADTTDSLSAGYVVAADYPGSGSADQIMAWHVGGTASSPALVADGNMTVTSYAFPANVPQPGVSGLIDSSDTRLTQAVAHADPDVSGAEAVWTQQTVDGTGGRSVVRWYELLPATKAVRQEGTVQSDTDFVFNGAVSPAMNGTTAVVQYNTGSATDVTQVRAQSRVGADPLGSTNGEITLGTSAAADQDFSCGGAGSPCRWGDYAALTPDPADSTRVWGSNQLIDVAGGASDTDPHWITRNFALVATPHTIIDSGPSGPTNSESPSFGFHSTTAGSTFECKLDGPGAIAGTFSACNSPQAFSSLGDGDYTFSVRATDPELNTEPTPAVRSFTVDTVKPDPPVITTPANGSTNTSVDVTVAGTAEPRTTVEIFDGGLSQGTTGANGAGNWSKSLAGVANGSHTYTATATDPAGNTSGLSGPTTITVAVAPPPPPPPPPPQPLPPSPLPADVAPPRLTLKFGRTQKLGTVLRGGAVVSGRCNEICTIRFQIQLPRSTARKLHIAARYVTIGKLTKRLVANRTTSVRIKLTRKARKQLAHVLEIKLRLTARATDASGNTSKTTIGSITLRR